jgi:hypothetical protein
MSPDGDSERLLLMEISKRLAMANAGRPFSLVRFFLGKQKEMIARPAGQMPRVFRASNSSRITLVFDTNRKNKNQKSPHTKN